MKRGRRVEIFVRVRVITYLYIQVQDNYRRFNM
jgi:hypothetical protein